MLDLVYLWLLGANLLLLLFGIGFIHCAVIWFGPPGRKALAWLEKAPGLDLAITYFTALPLFGSAIIAHIARPSLAALAIGFLIGAIAIFIAVAGWTIFHERLHRDRLAGPRIVRSINRQVGPIRNHIAVWWTALCVPLFWVIRLAQYVVYPPLTWLVKLPKYKSAEWVNVSRHKFEGLVGHDLIWCLYCDWMTGIWSLGSEMLRNVESFWCPIRFDSSKKCENCRLDFPDVENTWIPADGNMQQVTDLLDQQLAQGNHAWHGHPSRITIEGQPFSPEQQTQTPAEPTLEPPPQDHR